MTLSINSLYMHKFSQLFSIAVIESKFSYEVEYRPFNNGGPKNLMNQIEQNNRERRFLKIALSEDTVQELLEVFIECSFVYKLLLRHKVYSLAYILPVCTIFRC